MINRQLERMASDPSAIDRMSYMEIIRSAAEAGLVTDALVFGSRVTGTAKPFSDIDLAIMGEQPIPAGSLASLRDDLDWSDLPFKVDLVEWASTGGSFRKIIRRDAVPLADCRA